MEKSPKGVCVLFPFLFTYVLSEKLSAYMICQLYDIIIDSSI